MNTDKEKPNEIEIALQGLPPFAFRGRSHSEAIAFSFSVFSLSVFICVHPWFQGFSS
jgi:hypothetical protein